MLVHGEDGMRYQAEMPDGKGGRCVISLPLEKYVELAKKSRDLEHLVRLVVDAGGGMLR